MNRFSEFQWRATRLLGDDTRLLDQCHVRGRASVPDGWLVGIHLDQCVVNAKAGESREHMLHGLDLCAALNEGCGPFDSLHMIH